MYLGGSGWRLVKITSQERVGRHCNRLPSEVKSPSLGMFKNCVNVPLRDMILGYGGEGLTVGLDDWEVFSNFKVGYMIVHVQSQTYSAFGITGNL